MAKHRTSREQFANDFDSRLYCLIYQAREKADNTVLPETDRHTWEAVARALTEARPNVRKMMHAQDRAETI